MTKQEFLNIIDSGDKSLMSKHSSDTDFIRFAKETREECKAQRIQNQAEADDRNNKIKQSISNLIESHKDNTPQLDVLTPSRSRSDVEFYNDICEEFYNEFDSVKGNVLLCSYDSDKYILKVIGIYQNVTVNNFGNEYLFVIDGDIIEPIDIPGSIAKYASINTLGGAQTLEILLSYLESAVLSDSLKIDKNLFNTNADYFIMV